MEVKKILQKIAKKRKKKGYSYENMAEELHLTPSVYRKIETGRNKLTVERMFQIATLLEIPINKLLEIEQETLKKRISSYEKQLKEKDEQIASLKKLIPETPTNTSL